MMKSARWIGAAALALLVTGTAAVPEALAQRRIVPGPGTAFGMPVNRNFLVGPGLTMRQWGWNTRQIGRALSSIPPYALGYNPYPQMINYGPVYNPYNPYINPYVGGGAPLLGGAALTAGGNPYAYLATAGAGGGYGLGGGYGGGNVLTSGGLPGTAGYGGGNPYGGGGYLGEEGGALQGTASVISAQGQLAVQLEQAKVTKEQAKSLELDNRRKLFDEIMYERANTPSFTDIQMKIQAERLKNAQNVAPVTEIWSAKALNVLLDDLKKLQGKQVYGPDIDIDPDVLARINVVGSGKTGNIGVLRNDGRLTWPLGLRDLQPAELAEEIRGVLEKKALEAVRQAVNGRVNASVIKDLREHVNRLHRLLAKNVTELGTNEYIEAKRYLNNFDDAIKVLVQPDVANYFNQTNVAKGKTVRELVDHMSRKGLSFAPATSGDEAAYQALYQALVAYDLGARAKEPARVAKGDEKEKDS